MFFDLSHWSVNWTGPEAVMLWVQKRQRPVVATPGSSFLWGVQDGTASVLFVGDYATDRHGLHGWRLYWRVRDRSYSACLANPHEIICLMLFRRAAQQWAAFGVSDQTSRPLVKNLPRFLSNRRFLFSCLAVSFFCSFRLFSCFVFSGCNRSKEYINNYIILYF